MRFELASAESGLAAPWRASHLAALAIAVALGLWLGWQGRLREVSTGGDEAIYVALSHSLSEGHYRDDFLIGTPPHAKYPPGNPTWLLLLRGVAGPNLDRARFANLLLLAITALLTGDAVRRLASPWAGVGATAAVILNPGLLYTTWASQRTVGETYAGELAVRIEEMSRGGGSWLTALHRGFGYLSVLPARYALPTIEGTPVDNIVWYLILFGCGGIGLWALGRRWPVLVLTLAGSFLVLAGWVWGIDRLILPLLPGGVALLMGRDPSRSLASFGFSHVVLGEVVKSDWRVVASILHLQCGSLRVVKDFPPATVLLSLREAGSSDGDACRYLQSRLRAFEWGVERKGSTATGRYKVAQ